MKKKKFVVPKKNGRPSEYQPAYDELVRKACRLGATNDELAEFFGVSIHTLERWMGAYPTFRDALKEGRVWSDAHIADSLFHRARGYSHSAVKIFLVDETIEEIGRDGEKVITHTKKEMIVPYTEHYPPDTVACIFWLKNRRSDLWRDKIEHGLFDKDGNSITPAALHIQFAVAPKQPGDGAKLIEQKNPAAA